jgi:hypothetical protein
MRQRTTLVAHVGNAVTLANYAMQLLRWRFLGSLGLRVGLPVLIVAIAAWSLFQCIRRNGIGLIKSAKKEASESWV